MLKQKWENKAEEVMGLVDAATDAADFVKATEEAMRAEQKVAFDGLEKENPAVSLCNMKNFYLAILFSLIYYVSWDVL